MDDVISEELESAPEDSLSDEKSSAIEIKQEEEKEDSFASESLSMCKSTP